MIALRVERRRRLLLAESRRHAVGPAGARPPRARPKVRAPRRPARRCYAVRVEVRNLALADEPEPARRHGCFTVRVVEARSAEDANEIAMLEVWEDADLRARIENPEQDPPLLFVSDVRALPGAGTAPADAGAYTFFPELPIDLGALLEED
jgi:hypothetical protein